MVKDAVEIRKQVARGAGAVRNCNSTHLELPVAGQAGHVVRYDVIVLQCLGNMHCLQLPLNGSFEYREDLHLHEGVR
jgi:hypothetical protein